MFPGQGLLRVGSPGGCSAAVQHQGLGRHLGGSLGAHGSRMAGDTLSQGLQRQEEEAGQPDFLPHIGLAARDPRKAKMWGFWPL